MHSFSQLTSPLLLAVMLTFTACNEEPPTPRPQDAPLRTHTASTLAKWPERMHRTFFATVHTAGRRTTASGIFDYYTPLDFRLTAITETGAVLFDVRYDWAGIHVLRVLDGLPPIIVENLCRDVSLAMRVPTKLDALKPGDHGATLRLKSVEGYQFDYTFDPQGHIAKAAVEVGTFDTLTVRYSHFDPDGRPTEISLDRPLRTYTLDLSFTDQLAASK